MAYKLNKTDGSLLVDLIDGTIDTASTSLILVGRNYTGYGESFNENFIQTIREFFNSNPLPILRQDNFGGILLKQD